MFDTLFSFACIVGSSTIICVCTFWDFEDDLHLKIKLEKYDVDYYINMHISTCDNKSASHWIMVDSFLFMFECEYECHERVKVLIDQTLIII